VALRYPGAKFMLWIQEGLAVAREPASKQSSYKKTIKPLLKSDELFTIKEVLKMDKFPKGKEGQGYGQSYFLVQFLTKKGKIKKVMDLINKTEYTTVTKALKDIFNIKDWEKFEDEYVAYLKKL
jgi:hypothetical protein